MNCCQCQAIEEEFDQNVAAKELRQYRQSGPARTTRLLIDALTAEGVEGLTLLDIGGGIGAIQHELVKMGVTHASSVEASAAYIAAARDEAERQEHADRISVHHGDFVALAPTIPHADIVTLDRVICCYPDMPALVGLSSARARRLYGVVYPRDTWWLRMGLALVNLTYWMRRKPFRVYAHSSDAVDAVVRDNGLRRRFYRTTLVWQVVVYVR
jgi:hypothetical protein